MTPSHTGNLLDTLQLNGVTVDTRPWGVMRCVGSETHNFTIKHLIVKYGARTSLQYHEHKDELLIILDDFDAGYVQLGNNAHCMKDGRVVRISPGVRHRVVGPMEYLEISTYDDDTDTVRIEDDYGRVTP